MKLRAGMIHAHLDNFAHGRAPSLVLAEMQRIGPK